jgi:hypothetical protein
MTLETKLGAAIGYLTSLTTDLSTFRQARLKDKTARFDWPLAVLRWVMGGLAGAGLGIGMGGVQ